MISLYFVDLEECKWHVRHHSTACEMYMQSMYTCNMWGS